MRKQNRSVLSKLSKIISDNGLQRHRPGRFCPIMMKYHWFIPIVFAALMVTTGCSASSDICRDAVGHYEQALQIAPERAFLVDNAIGYGDEKAIDRGARDKLRVRQYNGRTNMNASGHALPSLPMQHSPQRYKSTCDLVASCKSRKGKDL